MWLDVDPFCLDLGKWQKQSETSFRHSGICQSTSIGRIYRATRRTDRVEMSRSRSPVRIPIRWDARSKKRAVEKLLCLSGCLCDSDLVVWFELMAFSAMGPGTGESGAEVGRPMHECGLQGWSEEEGSSPISRHPCTQEDTWVIKAACEEKLFSMVNGKSIMIRLLSWIVFGNIYSSK